MKSKPLFYGLVVVLIAAIAVAFVVPTTLRATQPPVDSAENRAVQAAIERAYNVLSEVAMSGDAKLLETIFVDSPDYVPSDEGQQIVQRQFGTEGVNAAGYLTLMRAVAVEQTSAQAIAKPFYDLAAQEGRELTDAERQDLQTQLGDLPMPGVVYTGTEYPYVFTFDLIEITGDRAVAEYDNGSTYNRATLRLIDGQWFVTGITLLRSHY